MALKNPRPPLQPTKSIYEHERDFKLNNTLNALGIHWNLRDHDFDTKKGIIKMKIIYSDGDVSKVLGLPNRQRLICNQAISICYLFLLN